MVDFSPLPSLAASLPPDLPPVEEILERTRIVALPLRVRFRGITVREAALIEGPHGWGEFAPFREYEAPETSAWLASALESAWLQLPAPRRESVEVNATIPAIPAEQVPALVERYPGCRTFKVKVAEKGQSLEDDVARVSALRRVRPDALVRVDANRGWTLPEALAAAEALGDLDYMEQPCASVGELAELKEELSRRGIPTRIAADESIRRSEDPFRVAELDAAHAAVLKAAPLGGVRRLLGIAEHLAGRGMSVTVASALDTVVGLYSGLLAAACQPALPGGGFPAAGLATQQLFAADVAEPLRLVDGYLPVCRRTPEPARLDEFEADAPTRDLWIRRIREAYAGVVSSAE